MPPAVVTVGALVIAVSWSQIFLFHSGPSKKLPLVQPYTTTSGSTIATSSAAFLLAFSMLRSSSGVPWRPPAMRALCTDTPSGAIRQNSVSIVVLIEGTSSPMRPRHPYMIPLLVYAG